MFASGSQSDVAYVAEVTPGTTPATPQMITIPKQSITLGLSKEIINDPTILSDRMERYERHGNYIVGGDIVCSLQHGQFDDFLEAALGGTWSTNVLKVGSTAKYFTIERGFTDISQYERFTGCTVSEWNLSVQPNAIVTSTFSFVGMGLSTATSPLDATPTAVQNKEPLIHIGSTITVGGASVKATAFTLNVNNNIETGYAIGGSAAVVVKPTESVVTGSMTFYFEDLVQYNRFLNETPTSFSIQMTDGTNTLTIAADTVKFNGAAIPVNGSGLLFVTVPFKVLRNGTSGTTITVTRSA